MNPYYLQSQIIEGLILLQKERDEFGKRETEILADRDAWKGQAEVLSKAIEKLQLSRTSPHNWKGERQRMVYRVAYETLKQALEALAAFAKFKESR